MSAMRIIDCHINTFTARHAPARLLPWPLMWLLRRGWARGAVLWLLRRGTSWAEGGATEGYARMAARGTKATQRAAFDAIRAHFPTGTRFMVMPLDMQQMKAGRAAETLRAQHDELHRFAADPALRRTAIPFAAVDPQRGLAALTELRRCVEEYGFRGVALYPSLGFSPADRVLMDEIYPYCMERNLPVVSHCSRAGFRSRGLAVSTAESLASPQAAKPVLQAFPELRFRLARFGGAPDWDAYLTQPMPPEDLRAREGNWLLAILDMLRSGDYPNLYVDIADTAFRSRRNIRALKVFLEDPAVRRAVLFATGLPMTPALDGRERELCIKLRAELGGDVFREIAETNPLRFLRGQAAEKSEHMAA